MRGQTGGYGTLLIVMCSAAIAAVIYGMEASDSHTPLCPYIGVWIHG